MSARGALALRLTLYSTFRYIPNSKVAIQEKLWSLGGSIDSGPSRELVAPDHVAVRAQELSVSPSARGSC